jgi:hypothetical protein
MGAPKAQIKLQEVKQARDISKPVLEKSKKSTGYCIRTGVEIPFNIDKPLSAKAFESWVKYEDDEYPEKYCHYSGEPSNGETSFSRPILKKHWNKAKELV